MSWRIEHNKTGYRIFDRTSKRRGRCRITIDLATHRAFAHGESDALRR